ncbi:hypothetical protein [Litorisediminicola beolgyonensis]|uniref:Lipoprotein n=1 Tax=Litorisediminicola beolgyonensis TaxID=1173614 RepID=A0ABW3ZCW9_9RHOB
MRRVAGLCLGLALAACTPQQQDQIARDAARSTVNRVLLERYPGLPLGPAIDCIIDNASAQQILALAAKTVGGPDAASYEIVGRIVQKPETIRCLAVEGAPVLLESL